MATQQGGLCLCACEKLWGVQSATSRMGGRPVEGGWGLKTSSLSPNSLETHFVRLPPAPSLQRHPFNPAVSSPPKLTTHQFPPAWRLVTGRTFAQSNWFCQSPYQEGLTVTGWTARAELVGCDKSRLVMDR